MAKSHWCRHHGEKQSLNARHTSFSTSTCLSVEQFSVDQMALLSHRSQYATWHIISFHISLALFHVLNQRKIDFGCIKSRLCRQQICQNPPWSILRQNTHGNMERNWMEMETQSESNKYQEKCQMSWKHFTSLFWKFSALTHNSAHANTSL